VIIAGIVVRSTPDPNAQFPSQPLLVEDLTAEPVLTFQIPFFSLQINDLLKSN